MSKCILCGAEIPEDAVHIAYAFVAHSSFKTGTEAHELCQNHTDRLIAFLHSEGLR